MKKMFSVEERDGLFVAVSPEGDILKTGSREELMEYIFMGGSAKLLKPRSGKLRESSSGMRKLTK